jgi:predicted transcriptional regulator
MGLFNTLLSKILGRAPAKEAGADAVENRSVDISEVLGGLAAKNPEKLDWKRSIVDLMKLVEMDSSLSARKELAKELNYTGDTDDSAKMNIWLHKEVLKKLAANGGKVPPELLD